MCILTFFILVLVKPNLLVLKRLSVRTRRVTKMNKKRQKKAAGKPRTPLTITCPYDIPDTVDPSDVEGLIRKAFAQVKPGKVSLWAARALDDYASESEVKAAAAKDTETHWSLVAGSKIETLHDTLSFLDEEGFKYYIPAFMIHALKNPTSRPAQSAVFHLTRGVYPPDELEAKGFNKAQALAVVAFLKKMMAQGVYGINEDNMPWIEEWANKKE